MKINLNCLMCCENKIRGVKKDIQKDTGSVMADYWQLRKNTK